MITLDWYLSAEDRDSLQAYDVLVQHRAVCFKLKRGDESANAGCVTQDLNNMVQGDRAQCPARRARCLLATAKLNHLTLNHVTPLSALCFLCLSERDAESTYRLNSHDRHPFDSTWVGSDLRLVSSSRLRFGQSVSRLRAS